MEEEKIENAFLINKFNFKQLLYLRIMKSFKKFIPTVAFFFFTITLTLAQAETAPVADAGPSWIENPIGSIIGLVLLIAMFVGMAKVALAKE